MTNVTLLAFYCFKMFQNSMFFDFWIALIASMVLNIHKVIIRCIERILLPFEVKNDVKKSSDWFSAKNGLKAGGEG